MAKIVLTAYPGSLTDYGCYVVGLSLGRAAPTRTVEARNAADVSAAVAEFGAAVLAANPGASFMVSANTARGARKFAGFDAADKATHFGGRAWLLPAKDAGPNPCSRNLQSPGV